MNIALLHSSYDKDHLQQVKAEMERLGAPTIRAFWSEVFGVYMAIEGCHRLRAAAELGLTPEIIEIEPEEGEEITVQYDGDDIEVDSKELYEQMEDHICDTIIHFDD